MCFIRSKTLEWIVMDAGRGPWRMPVHTGSRILCYTPEDNKWLHLWAKLRDRAEQCPSELSSTWSLPICDNTEEIISFFPVQIHLYGVFSNVPVSALLHSQINFCTAPCLFLQPWRDIWIFQLSFDNLHCFCPLGLIRSEPHGAPELSAVLNATHPAGGFKPAVRKTRNGFTQAASSATLILTTNSHFNLVRCLVRELPSEQWFDAQKRHEVASFQRESALRDYSNTTGTDLTSRALLNRSVL